MESPQRRATIRKEAIVSEDYPKGPPQTGAVSRPEPADLFSADGAIRQAALERYLALKRLAGEFEALKEQLKAALGAGAAVEPGPVAARLDIRQRRRLTAAEVIRQLELSPAEVARLRAEVPLVDCRFLAIESNGAGEAPDEVAF